MRSIACTEDVSMYYSISITKRDGKTFFFDPACSANELDFLSHNAYTGPENILDVAIPLIGAKQSLERTYGEKVTINIFLEGRLSEDTPGLKQIAGYRFGVGISLRNWSNLEKNLIELEEVVFSFLRSTPFKPSCGNAPPGLFERINGYRPSE